jgi:uncharacterized protein
MTRKITVILAGIFISVFSMVTISEAQTMKSGGLNAKQEKIVTINNQGVSVQKVSFPNNTITVVGNLYAPANFDKTKKYAAIITVHPFGGVKEQTSSLYAQKLAEQGFITLAYDASYQGESGGEPRLKEVPATRVEDVRCAVDYLSNLPQVDKTASGCWEFALAGGMR